MTDDILLVAEIERLRALVVGAYPYVPEGPGTTELVLEMEAVVRELPPGWEPATVADASPCRAMRTPRPRTALQ